MKQWHLFPLRPEQDKISCWSELPPDPLVARGGGADSVQGYLRPQEEGRHRQNLLWVESWHCWHQRLSVHGSHLPVIPTPNIWWEIVLVESSRVWHGDRSQQVQGVPLYVVELNSCEEVVVEEQLLLASFVACRYFSISGPTIWLSSSLKT